MTILIYQMGRVGSVALRKALGARGIETQHVHYLLSQGEFTVGKKPELIKQIRRKDKVWKVITLVREPISRNISSFFRTLNYRDYEENSTRLQKEFMRGYNHTWPLIWYDLELNPLFEFNIYKHPFNHKDGYSIYEEDNLSLLVLKTERLAKAPEALEKFLGFKDISIPKKNATSQRPGLAELYESFKQQVELPAEFVRFMYSSKYASHFYKRGELLRLTQYWANRRFRANTYLPNG